MISKQLYTLFIFFWTDETKSKKKGEYKLGPDSSITSLEDDNRHQNMIAVQAEGVSDLLVMFTDSPEDKATWIRIIDGRISDIKNILFSSWNNNLKNP